MEIWIIATTAALILVGLVAGLFMILSKSRKKKQICFVGIEGSGKTKLFYAITAKKDFSTITSQVRNDFLYGEGKNQVTLTDLPGHHRIRTEVMSTIKTTTAIIFVVDSETFVNKISDIANLLTDILSVKEIIESRVPILVLGSKNDKFGARNVDTIKDELEYEMNQIRTNRKQANYVENESSEYLFLGDEDEDFHFSQIEHTNKVTFGSCSVKNNDLKDVYNFIEKIQHK